MGVLQPAGVLDLSLRFPRWLARKVTTPRNPVRLTGGQARLLPADWPLGVIGAPRNSRGLPENDSRKSRPTTQRPLGPRHEKTGCAYPSSATRRPGPSALPAGTPIQISQSYRVGPSGRSGI